MYIGKKSLVLIFLAFVTLASSYSQKKRRKQGFDIFEGARIAPMAGLNAFYGDLVDESRASYTFGVAFEREMKTFLNARLNVNYGEMKGTQILTDLTTNTPYPFASFTNSYIDASLGATFKPLDLAFGYFRQRSFNPYVIGQIGINYFNATEIYNIPDPANTLIREESGVVPNLSLGGGLSYWVSPVLSLRIEVMANKPFSDLLDSHAEWPDPVSGEMHSTEAGDFYYTAMAGVAITIKDSRWKNQPKYNRKAYLKTKRYSIFQPKNRKKYKPKKRR